MQHSLKISTTETGKEGFLSLEGELTMPHACDIRKVILEAIDKVDSLRLDIHSTRSVDVSFLQLLCAAHRECFFSGKQISLDGGAGTAMESLLEMAGYARRHGCPDVQAKKSCLWANCTNAHCY